MEKIKITTPENIEIEYRLASLGMRTIAFTVDFAIQMIAVAIIVFTGLFIFTRGEFIIEDYLQGWIIGGLIIIYFLIMYGYFIIFELVMKGKTPGKKIFGLRTIRDNGRPITIKHSLIRNLFRTLVDIFGVGCVMIFFNKSKKRLGDKVASTIVVVEDKKELLSLSSLSQEKQYRIDPRLSKEESELLKDYFNRKDSGKINDINIELDMAEYFSKKLDIDVIDSQKERFLRNLLDNSNL